MTRPPQIGWLADGRRLHLHDGPIDLIVEARGAPTEIRGAYDAAIWRFTGLLDSLCEELPELRRPAQLSACFLNGIVARCMHAAVAPFATHHFITPMAAVAGAVAEYILDAMTQSANLDRAYVNNGGDIALHLADGERFTVGLVNRPDTPTMIGTTIVTSSDPMRGIATSGWRGRSFSLGIADAVTVLARTASQADAAATIIANAVDLPGHPVIVRRPANEIQPDNDLGAHPVTRSVGNLSSSEIEAALEAGADCARVLMAEDLIQEVAIHLHGKTRVVASRTTEAVSSLMPPRVKMRTRTEALMHV